MIKDLISFLWKPTSEKAICLIIRLESYLNFKDLKESSEYLEACYDLRRKNNEKNSN